MTLVKRWLPVVLWAALILSTSNDAFSATQTDGWFHLPHVMHVAARKALHIAAYGILGMLAWRAHRGLAVPVAIALAVASADEAMQSFTSMRTGLVADVVLDGCAAMLCVAFVERRRGTS